jgi:hypothetical protein
MINLKKLYLCVLLLGGAFTPLIAQPGGCSLQFDYFRTCQNQFVTEDFVFIGKVSSMSGKTRQVGDEWLGKINIIETIPIKENIAKTIDLYLNQTVCQSSVEIGKKYIFTAHRIKRAGFSGLTSYWWSTALDNVSENELAQIISKIRSVTKKEKQPSVTGKVVQYDSKPLGIYDFRGKSLITKLGYNPMYGTPIKGIKIIAKNKEGEIFETISDDAGEFKFDNLTTGNYIISPVLPEKTAVEAFQYRSSPNENKFRSIKMVRDSFYIGSEVCGEDIRFNVRTSDNTEGELLFDFISNEFPKEVSKINGFETSCELLLEDTCIDKLS